MAEPPKEPPPQVFVNFRGELRRNFVRHLAWALRDSDINVFIDSHEKKGRKLTNLLRRINKSTIALAIFSEKYCESEWCLDELVKMNEQMEKKKLVVIPIFFNVRATDVKRAADPTRDFGEGEKRDKWKFTECFKKMKEKYANDREKVEKWECAIKSVSSRIGFSLSSYKNKLTLVAAIVREIKRQLHMPIESDFTYGDYAFCALFFYFIFTLVIAPAVFPDMNFFKTHTWIIGSPVAIVAWYISNKNNPNKPSSSSS